MIQGIVEVGVWNVALKDVLLIEYKLRAVATVELFSVDLFETSDLFAGVPDGLWQFAL